MEDKILENHKKYIERINLYKKSGWDFIEERKRIIKKSLPVQGKILEIGAGKGYFSVELAKQKYEFISIDNSAEELEYAKMNLQYYNLLKNVEFRVMDAEKSEFSDNYFDVIFCVGMLHHSQNYKKFIDETIRILKPEGKFVLSDFSKKGLEIIQENHKAEGRVHPENSVYIRDIVEYLSEKNLKIERIDSEFQDTIIIYKNK